MNQLVIGVVIGAAVGVGLGYVLFNKADDAAPAAKADAAGPDRGIWPQVPSPPTEVAGEPQQMAVERLTSIIETATMAQQTPIVQKALACMMEMPPPDKVAERSWAVYRAWQASKAMPPDWVACGNELEPIR